MNNASLNTRITIYTIAVVTVISVLFAFGVLTIKNRLEESTFGSMVREQMDYFLDGDNLARISQTDMLTGWRLSNGSNISELPKEITDLPLGSHHSVQVDQTYYQVEVAEKAGDRFYLSYDITAWEEQEHEVLGLLFYGSLFLMLVAAIVAFFTSRASLRPLYGLTQRLANIQPDQRDVRISGEFQGVEVHAIATEFDRYLKRLDEFVEREKFISAAASHELRTPLSIIMGAIDVIESSSPEQANSKPLNRIKRACSEMLAFIEATLFLSREDSKLAEQSGSTNVHSLLTELLEELEPHIEQRGLTLINTVPDTSVIDQRTSILKMIIGNVLRNAVEHTKQGTIKLAMVGATLTISDTGEGIDQSNLHNVFERSFTTKSTGFGMGLTLAKKLCDRLGWLIAIDSILGKGTTVTIEFTGASH